MASAEIVATWAASSTPVSASSVTVAGCPTLISPMSASLIAAVIVSVFVLTISAKLELEVLESLDDDPACTESPANRSSSDTIVPLAGARSVVSARASLSFLAVCSSVSTESSSSSSAVASLVVDVEDEELSSASSSVSSAAVSVASASSRVSCAEVGSSVARIWPLVTCSPSCA